MSKITLTGFALLLALFLGNSSGNYAAQSKQKTTDTLTGTLQRMIVESGSVTMQLDLNRLNGISSSVEAGGSPANPSDLQPARFRGCHYSCISLPRRIPFSQFWFLTICCAGLSRGR